MSIIYNRPMIRTAAASLLVFLAAGCGGGGSTATLVTGPPVEAAEITLLNWSFVVLQAQKYSTSGQFFYPTDGAEALLRIARTQRAVPILFPEWPLRGVSRNAATGEPPNPGSHRSAVSRGLHSRPTPPVSSTRPSLSTSCFNRSKSCASGLSETYTGEPLTARATA